jgi:predicted transcriptional regulator
MAFDLLKVAKYVKGLSNAEFRVLFFLLADANNETFECYPSMKQIAQFTEMEERTVQRHISALSTMGLFERIEQRRNDGSRQVNCYRFIVEGSVRVGNQDLVVLGGRVPHQPVKNGGLADSNPPFQTGGPVQNDTTPRQDCRDISQESSRDSSQYPPLPKGEDTPKPENDLFGGSNLPAVAEPEFDLVDHVRQAWNRLAERHPGIASIDTINDSRRKKILARGKEASNADRVAATAWQQVLVNIEASTFLCGEDPPTRNYPEPFRLTLDYVLRPSEFMKIIEGGYRANRTTLTHDESGRRFGPAEQTARSAFVRVSRDRGGSGRFDQPAAGGDDQPAAARGGGTGSAFEHLGIDLSGYGRARRIGG